MGYTVVFLYHSIHVHVVQLISHRLYVGSLCPNVSSIINYVLLVSKVCTNILNQEPTHLLKDIKVARNVSWLSLSR